MWNFTLWNALHAGDDAQRAHTFEEIKRRWDALIAWNVFQKAPQVRKLYAEWQLFEPAWRAGDFTHEWNPWSDHGAAALREQALNLSTAEGNAQLAGYSSADVPALTAAERMGKGAPMTPPPIDTAPKPPPAPAPPDPNFAPKAALVGGLALGTVAGALAVRSDGAKAGIAIVGTVVTVGAGFALLWPKGAPQT